MTEDRPPLSRHREIVHGQVCFDGTRVPVDVLLGYVREGVSMEEFYDNYPGVSREHVAAALDHIQWLLETHLPLEEDATTGEGE